MDVAPTLCCLTFVLFYITPYQTEAWLFDNCVVSPWSSWRTVKQGRTVVKSERTRTVVRQPKNGGTDCPTLTETIHYTTARTAKTLSKSFLKRGGGPPPGSTGSAARLNTATGPGTGSTDFGRDILLVVDSSGSIGKGHFDDAKPQLAKLLGMVCPEPDPFQSKHQAALIEYSTQVRTLFDFNDKANTLQVQQGINNMVYHGKSTCTSKALTQALQMFHVSKGMRTGNSVTHELLLLSDGQPSCSNKDEKQKAIDAARELKNKGIEIYALIIGNYAKTGLDELKKYVSAPMDQHLFALTGYQELKKLVKMVQEGIKQGNTCAAIG